MAINRKLSFMILTHTLLGMLIQSSGKPMSPMTFEKHLPFVTASAGENVVLNCKVEGTPSPVLHWEIDGKKIKQGIYQNEVDSDYKIPIPSEQVAISRRGAEAGRKLKMSSTRSRLYLDCITPEDAGEYTCVATTQDQTLITSTTVEVEPSDSPPSCQKHSVKNDKIVRIYMWTVSKLEYEGGAVQLFCRVDGSPQTQVVWLDPQGRVIQNSDNYQLMKSGDLLIRSVTWAQNMGFYRCVAKNDDNIDEVSTFVYPMAS